jgi:hypothetical protein
VVGLLLSLPLHAHGSQDEPVPADVAWTLGVSPALDLWYHGLALAGVDPMGGATLYDPGYRGRFSLQRSRMQGDVTPLESAVPEVMGIVESDPAFEVLHFVPLYFPGAGIGDLVAALRRVSDTPRGIPGGLDVSSRFGVTAVATVLATPAQRQGLARFLDLVEAEAASSYEAVARADYQALGRVLPDVQARWSREIGAPLAGYLERYALTRGALMISAPVGPEGRILEGDPSNPWDNQIVIGLAPTALAAGSDAAFLDVAVRSVRELCYPAVRQAMQASGIQAGTLAEGADLSARAATRCGALLIDRHAPDLEQAYATWALSWSDATSTGGDTAGALAAAFPLPPGLESALEEVVGRD